MLTIEWRRRVKSKVKMLRPTTTNYWKTMEHIVFNVVEEFEFVVCNYNGNENIMTC
jgi:hypothetical protein